ncbi:hypothetical protein TNCV_2783391 [Trichonephila clavipes]|nr:hypothetical protein TNCV_2783391 [Trichonephila clavipes]
MHTPFNKKEKPTRPSASSKNTTPPEEKLPFGEGREKKRSTLYHPYLTELIIHSWRHTQYRDPYLGTKKEGNRHSLTPHVHIFLRRRSRAEEREEVPASQKNKWCPLAVANGQGSETSLRSRVNEKIVQFCVTVKKQTEVVFSPSPNHRHGKERARGEKGERGHRVTCVISVKKLDNCPRL